MINRDEDFPLAMDPPEGLVNYLTEPLMASAIQMSRQSPRRRIIYPLHKSADDTLQRMLNALQPFSYIRPHRHKDPPRAESIVILRGAICYVTFDDAGIVTSSIAAGSGLDVVGIDSAGGVFHTFFALVDDTVLFEVKPGPYTAHLDKDFAPWAPPEWTDEANRYLRSLYERCCIDLPQRADLKA